MTTLDRAHAEDALLPIARVADLHEKNSGQLHSSDRDTDMVDQSQTGEFCTTVLKSHCIGVDHLIVLSFLVDIWIYFCTRTAVAFCSIFFNSKFQIM